MKILSNKQENCTRNIHNKNRCRDFAAFVHLLKCAIGTGILFLPHAFRRTGYMMSIICGIVVGALCTHTAVIIVRELMRKAKTFYFEILSLIRNAIAINKR